jgi:DNA (cytosine-5)-methyltransferase 1
MNYYSEHDPFAAAWLRELIKANQISPGEVDERSIEDVLPSELRGYKQCHFFAGIGVWSYALRQAGWPDDREVWTGSCPCQPFSAAGKRKGTSDERHLWPAFYHLIRECSPRNIFGEQVASKDGLAWFSTVSTDLEAAGYAVGGVDLCAAGFGAPHIRQRLYFCGALADSFNSLGGQVGANGGGSREGSGTEGLEQRSVHSSLGNLANTDLAITSEERKQRSGQFLRTCEDEGTGVGCGLVNGFWREAEWIYCRDEKLRPIEPGSSPLATGITNRVGKLRGYGNALCAPVAQSFIEAYLETENHA